MLCYAFSKLSPSQEGVRQGQLWAPLSTQEVPWCACWFTQAYNYAFNLQALQASQCEGGENDLARYKMAARDQKS